MFGDFNMDGLVPIMIFAIPIVAIVGGITAGIVRTLGQQRLVELAQRERIAAIERGLDPDKIASLQRPLLYDDHGIYTDPVMATERRRQGLMIGGIVTLFVGIALAVFLRGVVGEGDADKAWLVGLIPTAVGVALLLCSFLIRPITPGPRPPGPPPER